VGRARDRACRRETREKKPGQVRKNRGFFVDQIRRMGVAKVKITLGN